MFYKGLCVKSETTNITTQVKRGSRDDRFKIFHQPTRFISRAQRVERGRPAFPWQAREWHTRSSAIGA